MADNTEKPWEQFASKKPWEMFGSQAVAEAEAPAAPAAPEQPHDIEDIIHDYSHKAGVGLVSAVKGFQEFAGSLPKALSSQIEAKIPEIVKNQPEIWQGETGDQRILGTGPGGNVTEIPKPSAPGDTYGLVPRTPAQIIEATRSSKLSEIGQTAQDAIKITPDDQASLIGQTGRFVGGAAPMALGPLAVPAFVASAMGSTVEDYDRIKQENPKLTDNEAAAKSLNQSIAKGAITAAVFTVLPPILRNNLEKYLVAKWGKPGFQRWLTGRVSSAAENAAIMGTQEAGTQMAEGHVPDSNVLKAAAGGLLFGSVMPWLREGGGKYAIQKPGAEKVGTQPVGKAGPGEVAPGVGLSLEGEKVAGTGQAPGPTTEPKVSLKSKKSFIPEVEPDPDTGEFHVINPANEVEASFKTAAEAKAYAEKMNGGQAAKTYSDLALEHMDANGGKLTKTALIKKLKWPVKRAEETLNALAAAGEIHKPDPTQPWERKPKVAAAKAEEAKAPPIRPVQERIAEVSDMTPEDLNKHNGPGRSTPEAYKLGGDVTDASGVSALTRARDLAIKEFNAKQAEAEANPSPKSFTEMAAATGKTQFFSEALDAAYARINGIGIPEAKIRIAEAKAAGTDPFRDLGRQKLADPEHQTLVDQETKGLGIESELADPSDPNSPFARKGDTRLATIDRETGKILINGKSFAAWLDSIPKYMRQLAVQSLMAEERNHMFTDPKAAVSFWRALTKKQQEIFKNRYLGEAGVELHKDPAINEELWGMEAINFEMQRLARMTPHQLAQAGFRDRLDLRRLSIMETAIRGIRAVIARIPIVGKSTADSLKVQRDILDAIQKNIDAHKRLLKGVEPYATKRLSSYGKKKLKEAGIKGKDATSYDALLSLYKDFPAAGPTRDRYATIAKFLADNFANKLKKIGFKFEKPDGFASYNESHGYIQFNPDNWVLSNKAHDNSSTSFLLARTVIHESVHAATVESINNPTPEQQVHVDTLNRLMVRSSDLLTDDQIKLANAYRQEIKVGGDLFSRIRDRISNGEFGNIEFGEYEDKLAYGHSNLHEFVAGIFDGKLFDHLNSSESKVQKTIWRSAWDSIKRLIGIRPDTNLEHAFDLIIELSKRYRSEEEAATSHAGIQDRLPFARPRKRSESVFQDKFILPGMETQKVAGTPAKALQPTGEETPVVPEAERKSAEESGALPRLTMAQLHDAAKQWFGDEFKGVIEAIARGEHRQPSFKDFTAFMKGKQESIQPGQLQEMWQQMVYNNLNQLPDAGVAEMVKAVLVPKAQAVGEVERAPGELGGIKGGGRGGQNTGNIWLRMANQLLTYVPGEAGARLKQGVMLPGVEKGYKEKKFRERYKQPSVVPIDPATGKPASRAERNLNEEAALRQDMRDEKSAKKRRTTLISALYKKLAIPKTEKADVQREDVTLDEIRFGGGDVAAAVQDFSKADERDPDLLARQLLDNSKRSADDPTTYTKRLTLIQDRKSGKVSLVSTYRRGEDAMLLDPIHPQGHHLPLKDMLRRYRVVQSILLDQPIQKFKKTWDTLGDYQNAFGAEAKRWNNQATSGTGSMETETYTVGGRRVTQITGENEGIPGTALDEGEGGSLQGPFRAEIEAVTGGGTSSLEKSSRTPLTRAEADALLKHAASELGGAAIESMDDAMSFLQTLPDSKPGPAVVSAVRKLAKMIDTGNPHLSTTDLVQMLAERIYEDTNLEKSIKASEDVAAQKAGEVAGRPVSSERSPTEVEITAFSRRPPTDVREENLPPGYQKQGFRMIKPMPEATTRPSEMEMLSAADQEALSIGLEEKYPYSPTKPMGPLSQPKPAGWNLLKERSPMAVDRAKLRAIQEQAANDINRKRLQFRSTWLRRATRTEIKQNADGADNSAALIGNSATLSLRTISNDEMVRSAPMAMLACGKIGIRRKELNPYTTEFNTAEGKWTVMNKGRKAGEFDTEKDAQDYSNQLNLTHNAKPDVKYFFYDKNEIHKKIRDAQLGAIKAKNALADKSLTMAERKTAKEWLAAAEKLEAVAMYVRDHWGEHEKAVAFKDAAEKIRESDPEQYAKLMEQARHHNEMLDMVNASRGELYDQMRREFQGGVNTTDFGETYFPGRFEGEMFTMNLITFGHDVTLGARYTEKKKFRDYYEAISTGPFIPKNFDATVIVGHRVRQGMRTVNRNAWSEMLKDIKDPESGLALATSAKLKDPHISTRKDTGEEEFIEGGFESPNPRYVLVRITKGAVPIAVLRPYASLVEACYAASGLRDSPMGQGAIYYSSMMKHGVVLIMDTFHPGRLAQYAAALIPFSEHYNAARNKRLAFGFRGGYTALSYRPEDLQAAVRMGQIAPEAAAWATQKISINWNGTRKVITKQELLHEMVKRGLNAGSIADAMHRDAVEMIPIVGRIIYHGYKGVGIGKFNQLVFGKLLPGLISESAVRNFELLHAKHPDIEIDKLIRDVNTDMNTMYGNMGRQGFFNSPTIRDLLQVTLLAPMWQEGLIGKELRLYGRLSGVSKLTGRNGLPRMGALGNGMIRGLIGYMVMTQLINLVTKQQLTIYNEENHKLDAWIPTGSGTGLWISPMSVFAETIHDIIRLNETKPTTWAALKQIGENKLGPMGRFFNVLLSGKTPSGEAVGSTAGVLTEAAAQLAPTPISLAKPTRAVLNILTGGIVSPNEPGQFNQQLVASVGIKAQASKTALQRMTYKASAFVRDNDLRPGAAVIIPTNEASYAKLRHAVLINDPHEAMRVLLKLREMHGGTDDATMNAMSSWARRPLTGGIETESIFLDQLTPDELKDYNEAMNQKEKLILKFQEWYMGNAISDSH